MHFAGVNSDSVLDDGDTASLGEVRLTVRFTPGHTRLHFSKIPSYRALPMITCVFCGFPKTLQPDIYLA